MEAFFFSGANDNRFSKMVGTSWRVDATYVFIKGKWHYLYRAVDKHGKTVKIRTNKYINNLIAQDHRATKRRCASMAGFKSFANAAITIAGIEPGSEGLVTLHYSQPARAGTIIADQEAYMPINARLSSEIAEMTAWRHDLHAHPELGFEEQRTSAFVAEKLQSWGVRVHRGLGGTGIVGSLEGRKSGERAIGLRADMDALPLSELNQFDHASKYAGKMHACGHDGHTTMLLGAAKFLAEERNFAGTVHFIFQPAEEGRGGAERMIREGLFAKFPCDAIYGLHNWPGLPLGSVGMRAGALMSSMDKITIKVTGRGGHGALPHLAIDPVVISAHIVTALQTLVSRSTSPLEAAVISITCIHGGEAHNVIPETVDMVGTVRSFSPSLREALESGIKRIASGVAQSFGATAIVEYERLAPAVINAAAQVEIATRAAAIVVGAAQVLTDMMPVMGSEDFAFMLAAKPGAYVFLGQAGSANPCMIHNPHYDFDDRLLPIGSSFWVSLVRLELPL
jgi:hippurate hydrolase